MHEVSISWRSVSRWAAQWAPRKTWMIHIHRVACANTQPRDPHQSCMETIKMNIIWGWVQLCVTCSGTIFSVFFKCDFFLFCTGTTDYELLACLTTLQFPQCRALPLLFDYSHMFSTEIMTVTSGNDFQRASIIQLARLDNHSQFRLCENSDKQHFGCEMTQIQRNLSFLLSLSLSTALASELL